MNQQLAHPVTIAPDFVRQMSVEIFQSTCQPNQSRFCRPQLGIGLQKLFELIEGAKPWTQTKVQVVAGNLDMRFQNLGRERGENSDVSARAIVRTQFPRAADNFRLGSNHGVGFKKLTKRPIRGLKTKLAVAEMPWEGRKNRKSG